MSVSQIDFRALSRAEMAGYIQSTQIQPNLTRAEITAHIEACARYQFNAAMIAMCWVPLACEILKGTPVKVATFFGFAMGNESLGGKVALMQECRRLGAEEVDYAPNMGYFLSGMYDEFRQEAAELVKAAEGMPVKVMLQTGFLPDDEHKRQAARLLDEGGVQWVKNSSGGWAPGATPATPEDIRLLRAAVSPRCKVKASGKINGYETAVSLLEAGAELLGTSSGPQILQGLEMAQSEY
ncbi:MAG: deoxyribose-phosphate aldolase [Chloroflexi bacterium]|jgi:deoxyribose-phosphate aldolase|nr:deoxyribose-phosphate aldolase [Anaerolineaceae bacterium]NMB87115.1 deoxyribose-phosphate aldolase [Chloroflexota bacterium]